MMITTQTPLIAVNIVFRTPLSNNSSTMTKMRNEFWVLKKNGGKNTKILTLRWEKHICQVGWKNVTFSLSVSSDNVVSIDDIGPFSAVTRFLLPESKRDFDLLINKRFILKFCMFAKFSSGGTHLLQVSR